MFIVRPNIARSWALANVVTKRDGQPLSDKDGPFQLVVPGEKWAARWVRHASMTTLKTLSLILCGLVLQGSAAGAELAIHFTAIRKILALLEEISLGNG